MAFPKMRACKKLPWASLTSFNRTATLLVFYEQSRFHHLTFRLKLIYVKQALDSCPSPPQSAIVNRLLLDTFPARYTWVSFNP